MSKLHRKSAIRGPLGSQPAVNHEAVSPSGGISPGSETMDVRVQTGRPVELMTDQSSSCLPVFPPENQKLLPVQVSTADQPCVVAQQHSTLSSGGRKGARPPEPNRLGLIFLRKFSRITRRVNQTCSETWLRLVHHSKLCWFQRRSRSKLTYNSRSKFWATFAEMMQFSANVAQEGVILGEKFTVRTSKCHKIFGFAAPPWEKFWIRVSAFVLSNFHRLGQETAACITL